MQSLGGSCLAKDLLLTGKLLDYTNSQGTANQVLSSTGSQILWVNPGTIPVKVFGSYASPAASTQLYDINFNKYVFWISVPSGTTSTSVGLIIGGAAIFRGALNVNAYANAASGSDADIMIVHPAYGVPSGVSDTIITVTMSWSAPTAATDIYKVIMEIAFDA